MQPIPLILSTVMLLASSVGYGQSSNPATAADKNLPTNATPMKTGVKRHTYLIEIKADQVAACKKLFAAVPAEVEASFKAIHIRNLTCYLKEFDGKHYLFAYCEYDGKDVARDIHSLDANPAMQAWDNSLTALQAGSSVGTGLTGDLEEVFFTEGAAAVVPTPEKYVRTGMITGLKPEKEAEYRTLHATTWPGVLNGISDCNYRDFSIRLVELDSHLFLIGYLEYVGKDPDADAAAGKALSVNKRWWKFTDACQLPLPAATAKGELWDGMTEIYHLD